MKSQKVKKVRRRDEKPRKRSVRLFDSIPVGHVALDRQGMIQEINRPASSSFQRPRSNLMGKRERIVSKRTRMVHQNGNYFDVLISASPLRGSDQRIMGAVAIFSDMTKRTQAEEEIKKLNEDLKRRTQDLALANKELEAFAYTVAHDLKSPLIIMEGFVRKLLGQYEKKFAPVR